MSYADYVARGRGHHLDWDDESSDEDFDGSGGRRRYGSRGGGSGGGGGGWRDAGYGDDEDRWRRTRSARDGWAGNRDYGDAQRSSHGASWERRPRGDPDRSWLSDGSDGCVGHSRRDGGRGGGGGGREHSDWRDRSGGRDRRAGRERSPGQGSHSRRGLEDDPRGGRGDDSGRRRRRHRPRSSSLSSSSSSSSGGRHSRGGHVDPRWSPPRRSRGDDSGASDDERWRPRRAASDRQRADSGDGGGVSPRSRQERVANGAPGVVDGRRLSRGLGGDVAAAASVAAPPPVRDGGGMPVRIFCGTWNVNGSPPATGLDLRPWLTAAGAPASDRGGGGSGGRGKHDIYVVAFQEVQPLSGRTAITTDTERGRRWDAAVGAALGGPDVVKCIVSRQLVGIHLVVYATHALVPAVSNVLVTDAGVGLMRAAGNKGAVAARFVLYGTTSIAVVSCHLAAHDHATERRNEDYHQVLREAVFLEDGPRYENPDWNTLLAAVNSGVTKARSKVRAAGAAYGPSGGGGAFGGGGGGGGEDLYTPGLRLVEADALFWLGDLNYRIDLPAQTVLDCIAKRDWATLRNADQLTASRAMGAVFRGFSEGVLDFAPTYKHATYGEGYALHEEGGVKRTPAWCDRILWRSRDASGMSGRVVLHAYRRHEVLSSDHRPVSATFTLSARMPSQPRRRSGGGGHGGGGDGNGGGGGGSGYAREPRSAPPPRATDVATTPPPPTIPHWSRETLPRAAAATAAGASTDSLSPAFPRSPPAVATAADARPRGGATSAVASLPSALGGALPSTTSVSVRPARLHVGRVRYGIPATGSFSLVNRSGRPVSLRLAAADVPPWLRLARDGGASLFNSSIGGGGGGAAAATLVILGGGTLCLTATVCVDRDCGGVAAALGRGVAPLVASLPLRPTDNGGGGGTGGGTPSPPPVLVAVIEGDYPRTALGGSAAGLTADGSPRGGAPSIYPPEVRRLCDRLVEASCAALPTVGPAMGLDLSPRGVAAQLRLPPRHPPPSAVLTLLDAADTGRPFPPLPRLDGRDPYAAAATAAGALYTLLASLRPPLLSAASDGRGDAPSWAALHLVAAAAKRVAVDRARAAAPGDADAEVASIRGAADAWVAAGGRRRAIATLMGILQTPSRRAVPSSRA
ncbi:hypothetical protein MMPV_000629 [Pyropia vietnamensis]